MTIFPMSAVCATAFSAGWEAERQKAWQVAAALERVSPGTYVAIVQSEEDNKAFQYMWVFKRSRLGEVYRI